LPCQPPKKTHALEAEILKPHKNHHRRKINRLSRHKFKNKNRCIALY